MFIGNYDQGLRKEERRQLIPIKENVAKKSLNSKKLIKDDVHKVTEAPSLMTILF